MYRSFLSLFLLCILAVSLTACAPATPPAYFDSYLLQEGSDESGQSRLETLTPSFFIQEPSKSYNPIGTPRVRLHADGTEEVYVDGSRGAVYAAIQNFQITDTVYQNFIYRIHFEKVPFLPGDYHLTAGKNVGLLVIFTVNDKDEIVLITTVHTCGCYLAFIATDKLKKSAFPRDWPEKRQIVFGKNLPAILEGASMDGGRRLVFLIEKGSHRVIDVSLQPVAKLQAYHNRLTMDIFPMEKLWHLAHEDGEVSFFEKEGIRKGLVRNSSKPLERLFMSWWAFDWYIGEDKVLGDKKETGTVFYTSLKFWRRAESDMGDFPRFLQYWGWNL